MLGKYIICMLAAAALPAYAQTEPQTPNEPEAAQSAPAEEQKVGVVLPEGLAKENPELAAELEKEVKNNSYMQQSDVDVLLANKTGKDDRVADRLAKKYANDINLHKYEAQLVYRQMARDKKRLENKQEALKVLSEAHRYTDEQLAKAAEMYDSNPPVEYDDLPSVHEVNDINANPAELMQKLSSITKVNQKYEPTNIDKADASDSPDNAVKPAAQGNVATAATQAAPATNRGPILSVQSIRKEQPQVATVKKTKRLGVKSYGINPDNFY